MRIAITSTGNSMDSLIDSRFGRCIYFVIFDTESKSIEFIPNPFKEVEEDAGPSSVELIASRNVSKIVSGEFGIKIKPLLDSLKIQMIVIKDSEKKVLEIIKLLNR
jgi:predicted Fe-Mo cluster-binding NifX family protein